MNYVNSLATDIIAELTSSVRLSYFLKIAPSFQWWSTWQQMLRVCHTWWWVASKFLSLKWIDLSGNISLVTRLLRGLRRDSNGPAIESQGNSVMQFWAWFKLSKLPVSLCILNKRRQSTNVVRYMMTAYASKHDFYKVVASSLEPTDLKFKLEDVLVSNTRLLYTAVRRRRERVTGSCRENSKDILLMFSRHLPIPLLFLALLSIGLCHSPASSLSTFQHPCHPSFQNSL